MTCKRSQIRVLSRPLFIYGIPALVEIVGIFAFLFLALLAHSGMLWRLLRRHVLRFSNRLGEMLAGNLKAATLRYSLPVTALPIGINVNADQFALTTNVQPGADQRRVAEKLRSLRAGIAK